MMVMWKNEKHPIRTDCAVSVQKVITLLAHCEAQFVYLLAQ